MSGINKTIILLLLLFVGFGAVGCAVIDQAADKVVEADQWMRDILW